DVTGAVLGLAAVDLAGVLQGLAVVGDQVQGDGERLAAAGQAARQAVAQGAVGAALELGGLGQGGGQGVAEGGVGGGALEGGAGGGDGADAAAGVQQHGPEDAGGGLGPGALQAEVLLADGVGVGADGGGGQGIMACAHGLLLGGFGGTSHSQEGPCVWHPSYLNRDPDRHLLSLALPPRQAGKPDLRHSFRPLQA